MNKTFILCVAALALLVSVSTAEESGPIDWFECSNKAEGLYAHPIDCTRFLSCSNGLAYEFDCAKCDYHEIRCPQGRLVFDRKTNMCLYANEAECRSLCDRPGDRESSEEVESRPMKANKLL